MGGRVLDCFFCSFVFPWSDRTFVFFLLLPVATTDHTTSKEKEGKKKRADASILDIGGMQLYETRFGHFIFKSILQNE
jgi:hypothetical protein